MTATAKESIYLNHNNIVPEEPIRIIKIFFASARQKNAKNASFLAKEAMPNRHERHLNSPARKARDMESTYNAPTIIE